ncbi:MAG: sporulation protein YqfD [Ruminococcus sp.]|nr:sporulation protein YqfD [Ruminococcus sp.]
MRHPEGPLFERWIRGQIRLTAQGGALYRFINALRENGITGRRQHCKGDRFYCTIRRGARKQAEALAEEHHVTLTMEEKRSIPEWLHRYRRRWGIPLGMLLGAALLVYTANVVMVIEIQGNETVTEEEILSVLEECSVKQGAFVGQIDFYRSELALRSAFEEFAWVGLRHTGNRIVVEVMETAPKPEMLEDRIPCHIVATKTAQITETTVQRGEMMHAIGDAVKAGEVLVSGIQTDEYGHVTFRHAMGRIIGIYEEEVTFFCASQQQERIFTGNSTEQRTLDLFSLKIPLAHEENPYSDYNLKTESTPLTLFGAELPIRLERERWLEYTTQERILSQEEMQLDLQAQKERYEENFLSECTIIQANTRYTEKETAMVLTVSYVLEGEIGMQKELFLKEDRPPYVSGRYKKD